MLPRRLSGSTAVGAEERSARGKAAGITDTSRIERRGSKQTLRAPELQSLDVAGEALAVARPERAAEMAEGHAIAHCQFRRPRRVLSSHAIDDVACDVDLAEFSRHAAIIGD